jgi:hypothetical protein
MKTNLTEIGGVKCARVVKYLGVKVAIDKKEQTRVSRKQIDKNIKVMRRKSRLRCYPTTCLMSIQIYVNLLRISYGGGWDMEEERYRQDRGLLISQDARHRQYDIQHNYLKYHYQHLTGG